MFTRELANLLRRARVEYERAAQRVEAAERAAALGQASAVWAEGLRRGRQILARLIANLENTIQEAHGI